MDAVKQMRPERRPAFSPNSRVGPRGAETHARLLGAGLGVLDAAGYHGARVETIAARAGCSRPTFYQYFADKADFFLHLAAQVNGELGALVEDFPALDASRRSRDELRDWLGRLQALHRRYAPVFRYEALLRSDPRIARGSEERVLGTGETIAAAVEAPPAARRPSAALGSLVYCTIVQACDWSPPALAPARLVEAAADWFHRCFVGPVPGVNTGSARRPASPSRRPRRAAARPSGAQPPALGEKAARSRARLSDAARAVFGSLGYGGARIDDIAAAAAVSHGTFYRYFASKASLLRELAAPAVDDLLVLLEELPEPRGGLHAWSRRLYQTHAIHGGVVSAWAESESSRAVLPPEVVLEINAGVEAALGHRAFGDLAVDTLLFLAHAERAPYIARTYPGLPPSEAVAATGDVLERGFFGRA